MPGVRVIPDGAVEQTVLRRQRGHAGRKSARHAIAAGLIDVDGEPARMHVAYVTTAVPPPAAHEVDAIAGRLEGGHEGLEFVGRLGGAAGARAGTRPPRPRAR